MRPRHRWRGAGICRALSCLVLLLLQAEGGRGDGPHATRGVGVFMPGMEGRHCEALPLGARAPLSGSLVERGCEGCKAPLLPLAAAAADTRRPLLHPTTLSLVNTFVTGKRSRNKAGGRFTEGMMQHRMDRFLPQATLRLPEAMAKDKAARLRHLLSVRRAVYDRYGPDVAVHSYVGDAVVRFSMMWRLAPDSYETCSVSGKNISVTRLAVQPVHESIMRPLWQLRLHDASDQDWNPNLQLIESPLQDRTIPDPTHAVSATFDQFMRQLNLAYQLGGKKEKGDAVLLAHMQQGYFGIARVRSEYEEDMDSRAFAHLLYRVTQAAANGTATVHDGMLVVQRMVDAGLTPSCWDVTSLMDLVIGAARNGSDTTPQDLNMVLDLIKHIYPANTHMYPAPEHRVYMAGLEALAWAARHGKCGGLEQAEDVLMRMVDVATVPKAPSMLSTCQAALKHPDLYASFLAVIAGAAHSQGRHEASLNVSYQEQENGMVRERVLEQTQLPLNWHLHAQHMMQTMCEGMRNGLVYHGRLQVAVGMAYGREQEIEQLDMEQLESIIQSMLHHGLQVHHYHAHSLLAAAVLAVEHDKASFAQFLVLVEYILRASLELDALCYSLWLRALAHSLAKADASLQDLLHVIHLAQQQGMRFSTQVFKVVGDAVARNVELVLSSNESKTWAQQGALQLRQHLDAVFEKMLYLGASPPKSLFDARLLLYAHAAEAGEQVSGYEAECVAEDMMVAGHAPDASTLVLMLRLMAPAIARGETGMLDVARIIERAICAKVVGNEAVLVQTLSAAEAAAMQGALSLADAQHLVARASVLAGTDSNKCGVLARLLRVAGAAAQHGLATVDEALAIVEPLLQALREAGAPARLDTQERDALVDVLAAAALVGTATAEDAESVMRHLDVAGERPSMRLLRVLLDVVLAESARGQATVQDAVHVLNRIKGCGFSPTYVEMSKVLSIVHASAQYGQASMEQALHALADLRASAPSLDAQQYLQVLDCAQWDAYWRTQAPNTPPPATEAESVSCPEAMMSASLASASSSALASASCSPLHLPAHATQDPFLPIPSPPRAAQDDEWATQTWHRMEGLISEARRAGLELGASVVAICARFARHTRLSAAVLGAWHKFRALPPRSRTSIVYSEMMFALGAVGNNEAVLGLINVSAKHGMTASPDMLVAAIQANPPHHMVRMLAAHLPPHWPLSASAQAIVDAAGTRHKHESL